MLLLVPLVLARPTEGGAWSFDDTDTVVSHDAPLGLVRVWYSVEGNNRALPDDADDNGVPDFVELVGSTAESVLATYEGAGFRLPLGDEGRGGTDAVDAYLVDFGGDADGLWASECGGGQGPCSGYFTMENDFEGYGYADVDEAVRVLTSHELFHGVQAAYAQSEAVWFLEGTAVWAEHLYDPYNSDFLRFCSAYLDDVGRSLSEPAAGPVPTFAYATALWWFHLSDTYGDDVILELMEAFASAPGDDELLQAMASVEAGRGGSLAADFTWFASRNLATGDRAGSLEGEYPFAAELRETRAEERGERIEAEDRVYPLATVYYELAWAGGDLHVATADAAPDLAIALHPLGDDGQLLDAVAFPEAAPVSQPLAADPGTYWLVVTNPTLAEDSTKTTVCAGTEDDVAPCLDAGEGNPDDTGANPGDDADTAPSADCGCQVAAPPWIAVLLSLTMARRRQTGYRANIKE